MPEGFPTSLKDSNVIRYFVLLPSQAVSWEMQQELAGITPHHDTGDQNFILVYMYTERGVDRYMYM